MAETDHPQKKGFENCYPPSLLLSWQLVNHWAIPARNHQSTRRTRQPDARPTAPSPCRDYNGVESPGPSGVGRVSTPGVWPHTFSQTQQYICPWKFWGFSYSAPCPCSVFLSYPPPASEWQSVKRSPRGIHRPHCQSGWAGQRAVTGYIRAFGDCTGFRFEKPHPGNRCATWAADVLGGFWGFISTPGKFF
jgi:hypothetical protein